MTRRKDLTTFERNQLVQFLLQESSNGRPRKGKMLAAAEKWKVSRRTVTRLWAATIKQQEAGLVIYSKSGKQVPEKNKRKPINLDLISSLPFPKRSSIRILACEIKISKTTVGRWIKLGLLKAHTNAIRPDLTAPNKLLRIRFSLEALELDRIMNILRFKNMYNTVHIDEKWFYITKGSRRFYKTPGEVEPHRTCKSKKFITKVMFMCAVCRPLIAGDGTVLFDGKIGIFPFTKKVPAKRASKNRQAGTIETKAIESVTKDVIRDCIINQIIPAIKQKWPTHASKDICIQQDNAKPHIKDSDMLFREAACSDGFNFSLVQQPPNSPDTNVNDLGWFRAIQSLQEKHTCKTVNELIELVERSFEKLEPFKLNNVFLSLQGCMVEIMKVKGQNRYKTPHMGKLAHIRAGTLPLNLEVPEILVRQCLSYLVEAGCLEGVQGLMDKLGISTLE